VVLVDLKLVFGDFKGDKMSELTNLSLGAGGTKKNLFAELGVSGLKQSGGMVDEEFYALLRGINGVKVYREMSDNSSTIGAIRYVIKALVRQVEWRVEASDPRDKKSLEQAEFVEDCLDDMDTTTDDFISEVLTFLEYGWAYFETTYKLRRGKNKDKRLSSLHTDGKIGWRKFGLRAQDTLDRWEFDEQDLSLLGMHQLDSYSGRSAYIPIDKALLFRTEVIKDNPEGRSIYRNAVLDWFFLKRISEIEAVGIELDMTGMITMEVPLELLQKGADPGVVALRTQFEKMLSQLKRDEREYALIPPELDREGKPTGYKLKLLSTGGSRQIDTTRVKEYYKSSILQSVLAQFIQLGISSTGSFALASSQTALFAVAVGNFLQIISTVFNKQAIGALMEANGVPVELRPSLVPGDIESPALAEMGAYVQALASSGMLPDDEGIRNKLLDIADLPMPVEENSDTNSVVKNKKIRLGVPKTGIK